MQTVITVGILLGRTSRTSALPPNNPCDLRFAGDSWLCCVVVSGKLVVALAVWLAVHIAQGVHLMSKTKMYPPVPASQHVANVQECEHTYPYESGDYTVHHRNDHTAWVELPCLRCGEYRVIELGMSL